MDGIEDGDRAYFYSPADVLLENFRNDSLRVSPFVLDIGIVQRFGEATFGNEIVQFRSDFCRWQQFRYLPGVVLGFKKSNGLKKEEIYFFSISKKSRGVTIMGVDGKCFIFPVTRCVSVVFPWARATE